MPVSHQVSEPHCSFFVPQFSFEVQHLIGTCGLQSNVIKHTLLQNLRAQNRIKACRYLMFSQRLWQRMQVFRNETLRLRASETSGNSSPKTRRYIPENLNPSSHIFLQMRAFSTIRCFDNCRVSTEIPLRTFCNVYRRHNTEPNDQCSSGLVAAEYQ